MVIDELETDMTRRGSSWPTFNGGRSAERGLPFDERAGDALSWLTTTVTGWYGRIYRGQCPDAATAAEVMAGSLTTVRWSPWFGEIYAALWGALSTAWDVLERPVEARRGSQVDGWLSAAREAVVTPAEASRAVPEYLGRPVTPARIRGLAARGRVVAVGTRAIGPHRTVATYQLGSLLDAMACELGVTA